MFLKIDADQTHTDVEVEAMAMAMAPTPKVLWRKPPVLALAALPGTALGHLGEPSTASPVAWAAAGAAVRALHDAPLPPWPDRNVDELASHLTGECERLVANDVLPADVVTGDVIAGSGTDMDGDLICAWWSLRCLSNVRWLVEHGFGPPRRVSRSRRVAIPALRLHDPDGTSAVLADRAAAPPDQPRSGHVDLHRSA